MPPVLNQMKEEEQTISLEDAERVLEEDKKYVDAITYNLNNRCNYGWANILRSAIGRASLAEMADRRTGKPILDHIRKKLVMTQDELMEKAFPRVTISSLYRRYNQIYLLALEDALLILLECRDLEEAHKRITDRIEKVGSIHKDDIRKHHSSPKLNTNVLVGED